MSAFRPRNLSPADLSALATDPDLADSEARLAVVLATRASQASVDNLGSTLGPAITAATADKATADQVAALVPAGMVQRFLVGQVPAGYQAAAGQTYLPTGGILLSSAANSSGSGFGAAVYVSTGSAQGLWRIRANVLQRFDVADNLAVGPAYTVPNSAGGTLEPTIAVMADGKTLYVTGLSVSSGTTSAGPRAFSFNTETGVFTQLQSFPRNLSNGARVVRLLDGRLLVMARLAESTQSTHYAWLYNPTTNEVLERVLSLPIAGFHLGSTPGYASYRLPSGAVLCIGNSLETDGQRGSFVLTVTGNDIAVGPAMPTGYTSSSASGFYVLPLADGRVYLGVPNSSSGSVIFQEGLGWLPYTDILAKYSGVSGTPVGVYSQWVPNLGWVSSGNVSVGGGGLPIQVLFTASPLAGASVVDAVKL